MSYLQFAELFLLTNNFFHQVKTKFKGNELKIMMLIKIYGVISPKILIAKTGIIKTNLASCLKNLINNHFVKVETNSNDSRSKNYSLTPEGEREVKYVLSQIEDKLKDHFGSEANSALSSILRILNKIL